MSEQEFAIIERYFKTLTTAAGGVVLGPGDDCAILEYPPNTQTCVSTDTLIEGVHFPVSFPAAHVATRVLGANLSDLAAMGAEAHSFVLAMTLPAIDESWLAAFSASLKSLSDEYRVPLVGGNLSRGSLSLTITVQGHVPVGTAVTRQGARPGDGIYVTGTLGDAGRGLQSVMEGRYDNRLAERFCRPEPRLETGIALRGSASSMIDVSDGLLADVGHLCESSGVAAVIQAGSLPLSEELLAAVGRQTAVDLALTAGDDYELCFTAGTEPEQVTAVTRIGEITAGEGVRVVDNDGIEREVGARGYQHF